VLSRAASPCRRFKTSTASSRAAGTSWIWVAARGRGCRCASAGELARLRDSLAARAGGVPLARHRVRWRERTWHRPEGTLTHLALAPRASAAPLTSRSQEVVVPTLHCDARVRAICGDALELTPAALRALRLQGFTTVLSDMCPSTTGSSSLDATRSAVLAEAAMELALGPSGAASGSEEDDEPRLPPPSESGVLLPGGALVIKLLEGQGGARQSLQAMCKVRAATALRLRAPALT